MPGTLGEFDMRVVIAATVVGACVCGAAAQSSQALPSAIYSSSAKTTNCPVQGPSQSFRDCAVAFSAVTAGQVLTTAGVTCNVEPASTSIKPAQVYIEAEPTVRSNTKPSGVPRIYLQLQQSPVPGHYGAALEGQAYVPGGFTPKVTVWFRNDVTTSLSASVTCSMQGRLSPL
jgi:hypothetical protein